MARVAQELNKKFYNLFLLAVVWFFASFTLLIFLIITISFAKNEKALTVPIIVFGLIFIIIGLILYILYRVRIVQDDNKIVIYGRRLKKISLKESFTKGITIDYDNIASLDLVPVKYFNIVLSYQVCINIKDSSESLYINSFSNLDRLFINIRTCKYKIEASKKKNKEE